MAVVEPGVTLEELDRALAPLGLDLPGVAGRAGRIARWQRRHQRRRHARRPLRGDPPPRARPRGGAGRRHRHAHRRQVRQVLVGLRPHPVAHRLGGHLGRHHRDHPQGAAPPGRSGHHSGPLRHPGRGGAGGAAHRQQRRRPEHPRVHRRAGHGRHHRQRRPGPGHPRGDQGTRRWPTSSSCWKECRRPGWKRTSNVWPPSFRRSALSTSSSCRARAGARADLRPGRRRSSSPRRPGRTTSSTPSCRGRASPSYLARVAELAGRARRPHHRLRPRRRRQRPPVGLPARRGSPPCAAATRSSRRPSPPAGPSRASTASARRSSSYFLDTEDPVNLDLMRSIKRVFDPLGILGPRSASRRRRETRA